MTDRNIESVEFGNQAVPNKAQFGATEGQRVSGQERGRGNAQPISEDYEGPGPDALKAPREEKPGDFLGDWANEWTAVEASGQFDENNLW